MKIVFFTGHWGFLRNFEHALRELGRRGHQIHLVADRGEQLGGARTLEMLQREGYAITHGFAPRRTEVWYPLAINLRQALDYWRYLQPRYDRATSLRKRAREGAPRPARLAADFPLTGRGPGRRLAGGLARVCERAMPVSPEVRTFIEEQQPDIVLVTPLLYFGSPQVEYVRAARALGIPSVLCVGSWDHLTTKGLIHEIPDRVIVWNEMQIQEAAEIHSVPPRLVTATGAQAYDHWFGARPSRARETFFAQIDLDPARPMLLYLCSSPFIAPREVGFVERWVDAIRAAGPPVADAGLLIRPHPQNSAQWEDVDLSSRTQVAIYPRGGANPVDAEARADYFDSMFHSAAVVGVNTSALIESAIVGRPVFTVTDGDFAATQEGTLHFQHLKSVNGGLLTIAGDLAAHTRQLAAVLGADGDAGDKGRAFVEGFVRPRGLERAAAPIFADVVEEAARAKPAPRGEPLWAPVVRGLLWPAAMVTHQGAAKRAAQKKAEKSAQKAAVSRR